MALQGAGITFLIVKVQTEITVIHVVCGLAVVLITAYIQILGFKAVSFGTLHSQFDVSRNFRNRIYVINF